VTDGVDVFGEPSVWRLEAILRLGLQGEELMAGASTGVGYPIALDPIISDLRLGPRGRALDLGAGLGGISQWMAWSTGADVVALEPEWSAAAGARRLFPGISVVQAEAVVSPFGKGSFDAVTLLGVVSLVDDLPPLIAEVVRLLRPGGRIGLSDLCTVNESIVTEPDSPNTFRSGELIADELERAGFALTEVAGGHADVATRWDDVSRRVDDEMGRQHRGTKAYEIWDEDRQRLRAMIEGGELHLLSVVGALQR
jgi:SAM-dependent methyltransferase